VRCPAIENVRGVGRGVGARGGWAVGRADGAWSQHLPAQWRKSRRWRIRSELACRRSAKGRLQSRPWAGPRGRLYGSPPTLLTNFVSMFAR
jgi:hypothetical protein